MLGVLLRASCCALASEDCQGAQRALTPACRRAGPGCLLWRTRRSRAGTLPAAALGSRVRLGLLLGRGGANTWGAFGCFAALPRAPALLAAWSASSFTQVCWRHPCQTPPPCPPLLPQTSRPCLPRQLSSWQRCARMRRPMLRWRARRSRHSSRRSAARARWAGWSTWRLLWGGGPRASGGGGHLANAWAWQAERACGVACQQATGTVDAQHAAQLSTALCVGAQRAARHGT